MINLDEGCKWDIVKVTQRRRVESYVCNSNDIYEDIHYSITVKRRIPAYHSVIVIPALGICFGLFLNNLLFAHYKPIYLHNIVLNAIINVHIIIILFSSSYINNNNNNFHFIYFSCGIFNPICILATSRIVGEIYDEWRYIGLDMHFVNDDFQ